MNSTGALGMQAWPANLTLGMEVPSFLVTVSDSFQAHILPSATASIYKQSAILQWIVQMPQIFFANFHWSWILYVFVLWEIRRIAWTIWWKAPKNVPIVGYPTILGKYLTAISMVYDSDTIIQEAYDKSQGKPFAIPMLDRYVVFISDRKEAERLEHNTPSNLSEIEALHELASTDQVLRDVKISSERYFRDGTGALKKHLRSNLPAMSRDIQVRVQKAFDIEFQKAPLCESDDASGNRWRRLNLVPALLRMITRVNVPIFVGDELGKQEEILDNLLGFFWSCLTTLVLITFVPNFLIPFVVPILMGCGFSKWRLYDTILGLAQSSVNREQGNDEKKPAHLVQWVSDMMKIPDAVEVAKTSLGLVFGSAFQIPMVTQATIYHLCKFSDYLPALRAEATEHQFESFTSTNQDMPYMDSFIKETARLSPGLILSVPRRVMSTYVSPDNIVIPEGNWLAVPQYPLMRDPDIWSGGSEFNGLRFVDEQGHSTSRFTHPSHEFPYWGSIRHACPARFYAAALAKTILMRLLCHYEFKLEKPQTRLFFSFGLIRLTNPFMNLLIRERCP